MQQFRHFRDNERLADGLPALDWQRHIFVSLIPQPLWNKVLPGGATNGREDAGLMNSPACEQLP
jgi:hypothetical protein